MALLLNVSAVPMSAQTATGPALGNLSSTQIFNRFCSVKLQAKKLQRSVIRAASSVQQQSDTVSSQTQVSPDQSLELNPDRPADKLPYRGAWFWVGAEMIHLMELPNPDPVTGRPAHGGRDRHACVAIKSVEPLKTALEKAGIPYTMSKSGRPALFARDPDGNALEFTQA